MSVDPLTAMVIAERERRGYTSSTKRCTRCGKDKPLGDFSPDRRRLSGRGRQSECKDCTAVRMRRYRAANPEARERTQRRSAAHTAAMRELSRRHRAEFRRLYLAELERRGLS